MPTRMSVLDSSSGPQFKFDVLRFFIAFDCRNIQTGYPMLVLTLSEHPLLVLLPSTDSA